MDRPELVEQLAQLTQEELLATLNETLARNAAAPTKAAEGVAEAKRRFGSNDKTRQSR